MGEACSGALVCLQDPWGVDAQSGGAAAAVAEPSGNGAGVDAGGDELGRGVVPQRVEMCFDPEALGELAVPWVTLSGRSGVEPSGAPEITKASSSSSTPRALARAAQPAPVLGEQLDGLGVERHAAGPGESWCPFSHCRPAS